MLNNWPWKFRQYCDYTDRGSRPLKKIFLQYDWWGKTHYFDVQDYLNFCQQTFTSILLGCVCKVIAVQQNESALCMKSVIGTPKELLTTRGYWNQNYPNKESGDLTGQQRPQQHNTYFKKISRECLCDHDLLRKVVTPKTRIDCKAESGTGTVELKTNFKKSCMPARMQSVPWCSRWSVIQSLPNLGHKSHNKSGIWICTGALPSAKLKIRRPTTQTIPALTFVKTCQRDQ